jgi:hypothetical protein
MAAGSGKMAAGIRRGTHKLEDELEGATFLMAVIL